MNARAVALLFCLAGAGAGQALDAPVERSPALRCHELYRLTDFDSAVQPGLLIEATEEIPAHCRVRGVIDRSIRFEVSMPIEGWQGRFMFHAPGGLAGVLGDTTSLMADGFAMATTDTGHEGANDSAFVEDDMALINYGFRANQLTTGLARRVVAAFYGRQIEHAYLWGCSNGGRAALMQALLYPEDYDGIIAGAPALTWGGEMLPWGLASARHQAEHPLTLESLELLDAASDRACDLLDGVDDGVIGDPRQCTVDRLGLERLLCQEGESSGCLSAGQIETARFIYTGITDESGQVLSPGVYPGAESAGDWRFWVVEPSLLGQTANQLMGSLIAGVLHDRPDFEINRFDVVQDREELSRATVSVDVAPPDFRRFHELGGKMIIYNGWHDMPCRAAALTDYWAQARALSGEDRIAQALRLYMVPGMIHCLAGPGAWAADYVAAIVGWVENDQAPGRIVAEHPGIVGWFESQAAIGTASVNWNDAIRKAGAARGAPGRFTRPLCPYPQLARYTGSGDTGDARNFACVEE